MRKIVFFGVLTALTMGSFVPLLAGEWKDTEISRLVSLPKKIDIVPPAKDLPPEVAAFSGRWEGLFDNSEMPVVLIVETISSTTVNVIYCTGKSKWGGKPDYSRRKGKVFSGGKAKIEVPVWLFDRRGQQSVIDLPLEMGDDLKTLHGETEGKQVRKVTITMKKIED